MKAKYNSKMSMMIDGLGMFTRYYNVTMYSTIQFDYYGDNLFKVRILQVNGVECNYPKVDVAEFIRSKKSEE